MSHDTSTPNEQWRDIPGYEGQYQVSSHGNVRSLDRWIVNALGAKRLYKGQILKSTVHKRTGYRRITIKSQNRNRAFSVHRLVALAFLGDCPPGIEVRHLNGIPTDNRVENLSYGDARQNAYDRRRHGTDWNVRKTHCPRGHELSEENIPDSKKKMGRRSCLACSRAHSYVRHKPALRPNLHAIANSYYDEIRGRKHE